MPSAIRAITRIQDADDFSGSLTDTYIPVWSNIQQKFVMTAQSITTPGGSTTQVQRNLNGAFSGDSGFTYNGSGVVTLSTALVVPVVRPASDSTTAWKVTKADGATAVVTVDTTNSRIGINITPSYTCHVLATSGSQAAYFRMEKSTGTGYAFTASSYCLGATTAIGLNANTGGATNNIDLLVGDLVPPTGQWHLYTGGNPSYFGGILYVQSTSTANARIVVGACDSSNAHIRFVSGTAPSSPADGQIWYPTSGRLTFRRSTTSEIFATGVQATGGGAQCAAIPGK